MGIATTGLSGLGGLVPTTRPYENIVYTRSSVYDPRSEQAPSYQNLNDGLPGTGAATNFGAQSWVLADLGSDLPVSRIRVGGGFLPNWGVVSPNLNTAILQSAPQSAPNTWTDRVTIAGVVDTPGLELADFRFPVVIARYYRLLIAANYLSTTEFSLYPP